MWASLHLREAQEQIRMILTFFLVENKKTEQSKRVLAIPGQILTTTWLPVRSP
jgi:hypothetical protein